MATLRPQDLAPRRAPPPAAAPPYPVQAPPPPAAATAAAAVVARPQMLPYTRFDGSYGGKEGVAESCYPTEAAANATVIGLSDDGAAGGGGGYGYDEEDDDGCGSCVDGSEGTVAWRERGEKGSLSFSVSSWPWWCQDGRTTSSFLWPPPNASWASADQDVRRDGDDDGGGGGGGEDHDDPTAKAARRQEEDRKFWEACLASGYP